MATRLPSTETTAPARHAHCPGKAALWKMRSVVPRYVRTLPGARALRQELCRCSDWEELDRLLDIFLGGQTQQNA